MAFKESIHTYLKELTLLCVEDDEDIQAIYKSLFEPLFKRVYYAKNGVEGLDTYNQSDIIISDYKMPNIDGVEMIRFIRERDRHIPIILVTAFEDIAMLMDAMQLGVNNFVKKPFSTTDLFHALENGVELIMGHTYLLAEQERHIQKLKEKEKYSSYQEELSFKKELSIIRNDFYYRLAEQDIKDGFYLSDFSYRPLDTMSGDLYSARQLNNMQELYFLVDGMGKGISASVSAILCTSFVNYIIDRVLSHQKEFNLSRLVNSVVLYMNKHLLEDEVLAASFVLIDAQHMKVEYAAFGMPAILLMDTKFEIHHLTSNNPPLSQYTKRAQTSDLTLEGMIKMLISSDGIHENNIKGKQETYAEYIEEDFIASMTSQDFIHRVESRIDIQEDDMTYIFLHKLQLSESFKTHTISAKLESVEELNYWYEEQISTLTEDMITITKATLAFHELLMNAYEHGALGLSTKEKSREIENDTYLTYLKEKEIQVEQSISTTMYHLKNPSGESYLITKVEDNGEGFDTTLFSKIFGFHKKFNGRGVYMAKRSSLGIYYSYKGNTVFYLTKL